MGDTWVSDKPDVVYVPTTVNAVLVFLSVLATVKVLPTVSGNVLTNAGTEGIST
jgi:hypothetical protein